MRRQRLSPSLKVHYVQGFRERLLGLIGKPSLLLDETVMFDRCNAVHTCFMGDAIDVVFLDGNCHISSIHAALRPWRVAFCGRARLALEFAPGALARLNVRPGDRFMMRGSRARFIRQEGTGV